MLAEFRRGPGNQRPLLPVAKAAVSSSQEHHTIFDMGEENGRPYIVWSCSKAAHVGEYLKRPEAADIERNLDLTDSNLVRGCRLRTCMAISSRVSPATSSSVKTGF